ncbi:Endonuclease/Exonuclease/phosphatase family protein [Thalassococcus halodurans]|uniref:Endonuclease/Exonuclease/phosphatase family protein n=1 Tax=Thalassococcus halodurans TaxID=373675 RepID=A0A1H5VZ28_9RHOB|nr:endonuclease/exonuclease/phosphatase family protein [Thalassococcus halodurans]SEF92131.1 Endonuclease/Exonuclease/phosphatase family protein [Thalassococcus halodurans]
MRLVTYNVEWFDALFDDDGNLLEDQEWSARRNITRREQLDALGLVFQRLDADAIMIIEAPDTNRRRSTEKALVNFADRYGLRATSAITGFPNTTQQEIALLYNPDVVTPVHAPQESEDAPRFDQTFGIDLDIDATKDEVTFSKPPLELSVRHVSGPEFYMLGIHMKSKAPHGARGRDEVMRMSIANRRKQLAQAIWLRRRIESLLATGQDVIALGDLNDGPGLDEFEELFGRSSLEIIQGNGGTELYDPHAAQILQSPVNARPSTARFFIAPQKRYLSALLDYILVSPNLRAKAQDWRIWHPFDDTDCYYDEVLRDALLTASDHFPVSVDLQL